MQLRGKARKAGPWTKFRLLMWKNFLQQWRHPIQGAAELLVPVLAMSVILLVRWQIEPEQRDVLHFSQVPAYTLNNSLSLLTRGAMNMTEISLAYSPQSDVLHDVLTSAITDLILKNGVDFIRYIIDNPDLISIPGLNITLPPDLPAFPNITLPPDFDWSFLNRSLIYEIVRPRIRGYEKGADLRGIYALEETTRTVLAAVEFDDSLFGAIELPINVSYALRFPERPRHNSFFSTGSRSWRTDLLFPSFESPGPRSRASDGGSDPGYVREMFIALQNAISTRLVSTLTGESLQSFEVNLQRFPHPAYIHDMAVTTLQFLFPGFIVLSFSYTAINIVRAVTVEKELQLKETLKIMGMPTWINWSAWFCKHFAFLLVAAALITVLIKVNWFNNEDGFGDYAVFTYTPWTVLFFFLIAYLSCSIFFCFMMSGFFSKGSTAALFTGVIWFLTYIPAFLLNADIEMSLAVQFISCLGINSAMSYGFAILLARESVGGMQWGDFMSAPATDSSRMLFGHVLIMLAVNCVVYMLVALYLEQVLPGPFGTPKPWYFLFHKNFWFSNKVADATLLEVPKSPETIKEMDPLGLPVGVKMTNLTKVFAGNKAVNNLSLNIYDDQITVLLGHNGAGKSTTISMLTGNVAATSGSVWVAGHDMAWHTSEARMHIGLCPQHNVLFNDLTVREHLEFFARLKGSTGQEMYNEIDSLIAKLELQAKSNALARSLSGGQKRRLCVGIALSGDAKVVLLDEPSSGMDPSSRRALWDLLQREKKNRSMILTTHFMDEADILGDRIAIMANGRLKCVGSPYFLKRHYGVGYTLVIVKTEGFDEDACTNILKKYIPEISVKEDRGTEVTYSLTNEQSQVFEAMLSDLESKIEEVKFKNYGLLSTTIEDVFIKVGSDLVSHQTELDDNDTLTESTSDGFDVSSTECLDIEKPVRGARLIAQHFIAVWLKLALVYLRSWQLLLLQILVPLLIILATLGVMEYIIGLSAPVQRRALSLAEGYTRTESLLNFEGNDTMSLGSLATSAYEQYFNESGIPTMTVSRLQDPIDEFYLRETSDAYTLGRMRHRWLAGATFTNDGATAWFSNFGYHDVATSLSAVHNALLRARIPDAEIEVFNHPLDVRYSDQTDIQMMVLLLAGQLATGIGSSLGIASAVFTIFYIKERHIRAKLLQRAAGIPPAVLWGAAAVFDWLWFLVISLTVVFSCVVFGVIGVSSAAELGRLYLLLMVYGAAMLPFKYLSSLLFKGPALGFVVIYFINVIFGTMGAQLVEMLSMPMLDTENAANIIDRLLQFFPLYSLITGVRSLNELGMTRFTCLQTCDNIRAILNLEECNMDVMCEQMPDNCCIPENPYFGWEKPGVMRYITAMLGTCAVLWAVLMSIEYNLWHRLFRRNKTPPPLDESTVDVDVADEARHAEAAAVNGASHSLVATGLTKFYGKHLAVNQVSFTVGESECFGLLGVNGAGKTTTFKMLMGDETVSCGDAFVSGHSVKSDITRVHENIGYCPQFDAVFGELTGRETLRLFSLLRGLQARTAAARTAALAEALGFTRHLDKRVSQYSGGNKRKLSTAVSLLGNTSLVFVDEPTTGVDPAAKRQVWRAIRGAMRARRGVVLTSHSMEECEALCSRLTIMVNGRFQCLGTPQHLKNKYSQGFTLTIKMKMAQQASTDSTAQQAVSTLKEYVNSNFASPTLMEEHQGLLTYYLSDRGMPWSKMFGIMERAKRDLQIEDYTISQTTLEQIFLQFTKYQQSAAVFR